MSTPAQDQPTTTREERRTSLSKYVKRIRSAWKRASIGGVQSGEASGAETKPESERAPAPPPAPALAQSESREPADPILDHPEAGTGTGAIADPVFSSTHARSAAQQERARALFAQYGLTLEPHEWVTTTSGRAATTEVRRVERPIRMRVHRTCHRCQTSFGADKVCVGCEHRRCKKCPRFPARRDKDKDGIGAAEGKGKSAEDGRSRVKPTGPVGVTPGTGARRFVAAPVMRMPAAPETCHACNRTVVPVATTFCPNCQHVRCKSCPETDRNWSARVVLAQLHHRQEDDDPDGAPSAPPVPYRFKERTIKKPRQRVRWSCERCATMFALGKTCAKCGHDRCGSCKREPPKKVKKEYDPAVVKSLEAKLAAMSVSNRPPASAVAAAA